MTTSELTAAEQIWLSLIKADSYEQNASELSSNETAQRATKKWMLSMARNMKQRFPSRLKAQRLKQGLTQDQLAYFAGLTTTAVAMIERGERTPSLETAAKLCWALDTALVK